MGMPRTTIVGGRPPKTNEPRTRLSRGIETIIQVISSNPDQLDIFLQDPVGFARSKNLVLDVMEESILKAADRPQLIKLVQIMQPKIESRRRFFKQAASVLGVLGASWSTMLVGAKGKNLVEGGKGILQTGSSWSGANPPTVMPAGITPQVANIPSWLPIAERGTRVAIDTTSPTATPESFTPTPSPTPTGTTTTPGIVPTPSPSPERTQTPLPTPTDPPFSPTLTPSPSQTPVSPGITPTITPSPTHTPTAQAFTPTPSPTYTFPSETPGITPTPPPTPSRTPTDTPSPGITPTPPPTPTRTQVQTPSPPPTPTQAGPSPTPVDPTSTPTVPGETGVYIQMPSHFYRQGDLCNLKLNILNNGPALQNVPLFVVLQVGGNFFCGPGWKQPPDLSYYKINVPNGWTQFPVIDDFEWPPGTGSMDTLYFWAGMTSDDLTDAFGHVDSWKFGYGD